MKIKDLFNWKKKKQVKIPFGIFSKKRNIRFILDKSKADDLRYINMKIKHIAVMLPIDISKLLTDYLEEITGEKRPEGNPDLFLWEIKAESILRSETAFKLVHNYLGYKAYQK